MNECEKTRHLAQCRRARGEGRDARGATPIRDKHSSVKFSNARLVGEL